MAPLVIYLSMGAKVPLDGREGVRHPGPLADLAGWYNAAIMVVLFLVLGVLLTGQGIAGLS